MSWKLWKIRKKILSRWARFLTTWIFFFSKEIGVKQIILFSTFISKKIFQSHVKDVGRNKGTHVVLTYIHYLVKKKAHVIYVLHFVTISNVHFLRQFSNQMGSALAWWRKSKTKASIADINTLSSSLHCVHVVFRKSQTRQHHFLFIIYVFLSN